MLRTARLTKNFGSQLLKYKPVNETKLTLNLQRNAINRVTATCFSKWSKIQENNEFLRRASLKQFNNIIANNGRTFCSLPSHSRIDLPALSPTMKTGSVLSWEKKEGEKLNEGDLLCEIETDKATMGFETPEEGYLAKILIPGGTRDVAIGKLLCIIVENESDVAAFKNFSDAGAAPAAAPSKPTAAASAPAFAAAAAPTPSAPSMSAAAAGGRVIASPLAKKLAAEKGVNLASIKTGSGPGGRIIAKDVMGAPATGMPKFPSFAAAAPLSTSPYDDIPISNMRQVIARRLLESKQSIPHYYLQVDIVVDDIMETRSKFNELLSDEGIKVSVNDFIVKACALACQRVPEVNSSWQDSFIRQYNSVDVNVAVSTDNGLIAPIVFQAERKGLRQIAIEVKALSQKAKQGNLQPQEFQGGTFTVSNLGMFGVKNFSAVINPPQACILAIGAVEKQVVACEASGEPKVSDVLNVTLSCDHRVVDGAVGARWLQIFKQYMENPMTMIL